MTQRTSLESDIISQRGILLNGRPASWAYAGPYVPRKPLSRWVKLLIMGVSSLLIAGVCLVAALLYWRGNLVVSRQDIRWIDLPLINTAAGTIYRTSDVKSVFTNRRPSKGPERLVPNATIGVGNFSKLVLLTPNGDLTIKGDVYVRGANA